MNHPDITNDKWGPYIRIQGISAIDSAATASNELRAALVDKAVTQAESIINAIETGQLDHLPLVVQSLDHETGGFVTNRILCMLLALVQFLRDSEHADVRERLASASVPMGAWVLGKYCVTSPVLLVIQAILYSHSEWFHEKVFETYSATRAYQDLAQSGFPDEHCWFITMMIAHQTLLRATWTTGDDQREVLALKRNNNDQYEFVNEETDGAVAQGIAKTLFRFLKETGDNAGLPPLRKRQVAAAQVLHSLCLYCRHSRQVDPAALRSIKAQALNFVDYLLSVRNAHQGNAPILVFMQYGRYVHSVKPNLLEQAEEYIQKKVKERKHKKDNEDNWNVSFIFQRVSSKHVWKEVTITHPDGKKASPNQAGITLKELVWVESMELTEPEDASAAVNHKDAAAPWNLIQPTAGSVFQCHIEPAHYLLKTVGLNDLDNINTLMPPIKSWLGDKT